jgi:hypothetical protein
MGLIDHGLDGRGIADVGDDRLGPTAALSDHFHRRLGAGYISVDGSHGCTLASK